MKSVNKLQCQLQGGTLHFDFVRLHDAGTYRCSGTPGVDDQTVTLAVVEPRIGLFVDGVHFTKTDCVQVKRYRSALIMWNCTGTTVCQ